MTSARTTTASNHSYKAGESLWIRGGFKIRDYEDSTSSRFASDVIGQEYIIQGLETGAMSLFGSVLAVATSATLLAAVF